MLLFAAAASVRSEGAVLRLSCAADAERVAVLAAGQAVEIRFALNGDLSCYKVAAEIDGRTLTGYVLANELADLGTFERARRTANFVVVQQLENRTVAAVSATLASDSGVRAAVESIRRNEPARALTMLQPLARSNSDPNLLALAGIAAWKSDDSGQALVYWKRSLELRPDPEVERLYNVVKREAAGDRSTGKLYGLRVLLRYEPDTMSADLARSMVLALDTELTRVSNLLGCIPSERLVAVVQSREAYLASTGAAEWSGGRYDGRIRIALIDEGAVGAKTRRVFAHEIAHACLATLGSWPSWLHEGLAQKLSGDQLSPAARDRLSTMIANRQFPKLEHLGENLASMARADATATYALALLAAERLTEQHGGIGLRNILSNPGILTQITEELDRQLGL